MKHTLLNKNINGAILDISFYEFPPDLYLSIYRDLSILEYKEGLDIMNLIVKQ